VISQQQLQQLIKKQEQQIINIAGFVKSINIQSKSCVVFDAVTQTNYNISIDGFLPLSEGDAICGHICPLGSGFTFLKKPLVKLSVDEHTIVQSIRKALKYQINDSLAKKVYTAAFIAAEGDTVDEYLDKMAIDLHEKQIEDFGPLPDFLMESQLFKLLKWWYKSRTMRKLYVLGLNNKEIKESENIMNMTPSEIYEQCMKDAFRIISISIDKCKIIYDMLGLTYDDDKIYRATIVRKVHSNNIDKAWTGTPSKYILDQFKSINKNMVAKLEEEYGVIGELGTLYLKFHYTVETTIAEILSKMINDNNSVFKSSTTEIIQGVFKDSKLTDEQKSAVTEGLNKRITIISGGPGTGKTNTIKSLVLELERLGIPYAVASFTGKAVARLKEVLKNNKPMTLHMMIAKRKQIAPFKHLIIDESSMVTTELLYFFFKSFGFDFNITFVGDRNQLQPISYGNLFTELIVSGCLTPIYLTKNHRVNVTGIQDDLVYNANLMVDHYYKILNRDPDEFIPPIEFHQGNNFFKLEGGLDIVFEIVRLMSDKGIKSDDLMVISPYVKYLDEINRNCQKIFNNSVNYITCPRGIKWSIGDKVRIVANNYNLNLMNGDAGHIIDLITEPGKSGYPEIQVQFASGQTVIFDVNYDIDDKSNYDMSLGTSETYLVSNNPSLSLLTHNFCSTVHSMQGNETDTCIFFLPREDKINPSFINFNLLYTAITRSKKMCFVVGDIQQFDLHSTISPAYRVDNLARRIQLLCNENNNVGR